MISELKQNWAKDTFANFAFLEEPKFRTTHDQITTRRKYWRVLLSFAGLIRLIKRLFIGPRNPQNPNQRHGNTWDDADPWSDGSEIDSPASRSIDTPRVLYTRPGHHVRTGSGA